MADKASSIKSLAVISPQICTECLSGPRFPNTIHGW
ncbi:hypothetical protein ACHAXR_005338 [Thalassiosira sp. AJA248-18]